MYQKRNVLLSNRKHACISPCLTPNSRPRAPPAVTHCTISTAHTAQRQQARRRKGGRENRSTHAPDESCGVRPATHNTRKPATANKTASDPWQQAQSGWMAQRLRPVCRQDAKNFRELRLAMAAAAKTRHNAAHVTAAMRKLSLLGVYDADLQAMLVSWLVLPDSRLSSKQCSQALFSCALSGHFDSRVDVLAVWGSRQDTEKWKAQEVSNALSAWAMLTASVAGADTPNMRSLAQHLFAEASRRGAAGFLVPNDLGKLASAHWEAQFIGFPGGGITDAQLLQAAEAEAVRVQEEVVNSSTGLAVEAVAETLRVAARTHPGCIGEVQVSASGGTIPKHVVVQCLHNNDSSEDSHGTAHNSDVCVNKELVAVALATSTDYARYPAGWLRGKAALRLTHIARSGCSAGGEQMRVVVVVLEEWERCADEDSRLAYLMSRLEMTDRGGS